MLDESRKAARVRWTPAEYAKWRAKLEREICARVFGGCHGSSARAGSGSRDFRREPLSALKVRDFAEMLGLDWHATTKDERDALYARLMHQWRVYNGPQAEDMTLRGDREARRAAGRKIQARERAAIDARTRANHGGKSSAASGGSREGPYHHYARALGVSVEEAGERVTAQYKCLHDAGPAVVLGAWGDVAPFDLGALNDKARRRA